MEGGEYGGEKLRAQDRSRVEWPHVMDDIVYAPRSFFSS